jgi:hypothetical protein
MYLPEKYFRGLSSRRKTARKKEIQARSRLSWKNRSAYRPFSTDKNIKTRKSKYISRWSKIHKGKTSLSDYSKITGVPLSDVKQSYNRGMAAWRTGHRPGATQQQWGYARVASMVTCGKTHYTADSDLVRHAKKKSAKARKWFKKTCKSSRSKE